MCVVHLVEVDGAVMVVMRRKRRDDGVGGREAMWLAEDVDEVVEPSACLKSTEV